MLPRIPRKISQLVRPHMRTLTASTNALNNRIYDPVRNDPDFHTLLRLATTTSTPLLTLWTASYCSSCRAIKPLLSEILERRNVGVGFAEVELDAPGMVDVGMRYTVNKVPTLLVFSRGEVKERIVDGKVLADRVTMEALVERVASEREVGRGWFTGVFGG
ncbi:hypothetical protein DFP73DRAFT_178176 [Morchella snyderi]|nr:hypothetical protein DFP73DRAFT_178176 [Morchella snyderi]